jgi:hypothetical protein
MKKYFIILIFLFLSVVQSQTKDTVQIFEKGCPHCGSTEVFQDSVYRFFLVAYKYNEYGDGNFYEVEFPFPEIKICNRCRTIYLDIYFGKKQCFKKLQ